MLAVKNVLLDGREDIIEAVAVSLGKELKENAQSSNDTKDVLIVEKANGNIVQLTFGIVYVTNSNGSTIAVYKLNESEWACQCSCTCESK